MSTQEYIDILKVHDLGENEQSYTDAFLGKTLIPIRQNLFKRINCSSGFLCCTGRCTTGCGDISINLGGKITIDKVFYSSYLDRYIFELSCADGQKFRLDQRGLRIRFEYEHVSIE